MGRIKRRAWMRRPRLGRTGLRFDRQTWQQIITLAEMAVNNPPAVLLGDFNMADWWGEYAYLSASGLKDAFRAAGGKAKTAIVMLRRGVGRKEAERLLARSGGLLRGAIG